MIPLAFYILGCIGLGSYFFALLGNKYKDTPSLKFLLYFLMGQGLWGWIFHFPILLGAFESALIILLLTPFAFMALYKVWQDKSVIYTDVRDGIAKLSEVTIYWRVIAFLITGMLVLGGSALSLELTDDAKAFYMVIPKVIASKHQLVSLPFYEDFMAVGLIAEFQLAALYLLGMGGGSPKIFSWIVTLVGVIIFLGICREAELGIRAQIVAISILTTSTAVALLWGTGKTDFFAATFSLGAIYYAIKKDNGLSRHQLIIVVALLVGFSLLSKLSYLVAFFPGILLLLFWADICIIFEDWRVLLNGNFVKKIFIEGGLLLLVIGIVFIPQFAKNWLLFQDAFKSLDGGFVWFKPETIKHIALTYPFGLTYGNYWGQFGNMSPLFLACIPAIFPLIITTGNIHSQVIKLLIASFIGIFLWVLIFPGVLMPRYYLGTLLVVIIPIAFAANELMNKSRLIEFSLYVAILLTSAIYIKVWAPELFPIKSAYRNIIYPGLKESISSQSELDARFVAESINQDARVNSRVFVFSYFKFYLRPDLIMSASNQEDSKTTKVPSDFWNNLKVKEFEYLLIESTYNNADLPLLLNSMPEYVELAILHKSGNWSAYRIIRR